jgi:hypothetical protein
MANLEDLVVNLRLNADQMKAGLGQVQSQIKGLGSGVTGSVAPVNGLTAAFGGLVKAMLPVVAVTSVIAFFKDSAKAAAEDNEAQVLLARQLKNTVGATKEQVAAVEDQISALEKVSGVADDEIRPSFTKLLLATKDSAKAMELQTLAMDVSAGTGKSLTAVTMAFSRAAAGNDTALNRLIPSIKNVSDKTGFLKQNFDGAAKAAADANPYKRLNTALDNIKEGLGRGLLPVVEVLSTLMQALVPVFDMLGVIFKKVLDPIMKLVSVILDALMPPIEVLMTMLGEVIDGAMAPLADLINQVVVPAVKMIGEWLMFLMPIIKLVLEVAILRVITIIQFLTAILKPFIDMLQVVWENLAPLRKQLQIVFNIFQQIAKQLYEKLIKAFKELYAFLVKNIIPIWDALMKAMKPFVDFVINGLVGAFKALMKILGPLWENVLKPIVETIMKALGIKIDMKAAMKVDDTEVDKAVKKAKDKKGTFDLFGGGSGGTAGAGTGGKSSVTNNNTNINTNVEAKTDASPTDIAANIVNAIKFNLPVAMANGTGILPTNAGSQLRMFGA